MMAAGRGDEDGPRIRRAQGAERSDLLREEFDDWLDSLGLDNASFARITGYGEQAVSGWVAPPKWVVTVLKLIEIKPEVAERTTPRLASIGHEELFERLAALHLRRRGVGLLEFASITGMKRQTVRRMRKGELPIYGWVPLVLEYLETEKSE